MASYTPTTTCNDLATRIADELARTDLTSQIRLEINSAILFYASREMWGTEGSWSTSTVAGQRLYDVAVNFRSISSAIASYNSSNYQYPILPRTFEFIQSIDFGLSNFNSYPQYYAYQGNQFRFYPPTLGSGTITVYGQLDELPLVFSQTTAWASGHAYTSGDYILDSNNNVQICTVSGTSDSTEPTWATTLNTTTTDNTVTWSVAGTAENFWTTEAEELIRQRAKSQLCYNYVLDDERGDRYAVLERLAYQKMKGDNIVRGVSSGQVRPTQW